ncbi:MAG TPA: ABC transporter ATP-binding protein [Polyangiaceae bacterium]|nr:ABC transporter ATP-binding protein [Polyangiaceae bacterium]
MSLLSVRNLTVEFTNGEEGVRAVDDLGFEIEPGEIVGLVGESGSGKSVSTLAVLGLLEGRGVITRGSAWFGGEDLMKLSSERLRRVRGRRIALVFQDPLTSLNPYLTLDEQMCEVAEVHLGLSRKAARSRAVELLTRVGIAEAEKRLRGYPHQLSGGMRQRVCIAMALLCGPDLLIADEPTTMLDVTIQAQILELLRELRRERNMSLLFITHDLGVVAELADRVVVMYAGRVVEEALTQDLFREPLHPYTEALLKSTPRIDQAGGGKLSPIGGFPPRLGLQPVTECTFAPRCSRVREGCRHGEPKLFTLATTRRRRCIAPVEEMQSERAP